MSYRNASSSAPHSHFPIVCIAQEYLKTPSTHSIARPLLLKALAMAPNDIIAINELAVLSYYCHDYNKSIQLFDRVLKILMSESDSLTVRSHSPQIATCYSNAAHCFRKLKQYQQAIQYYTTALKYTPNKQHAPLLSALGFTKHLEGQLNDAIDFYHRSLTIQSDDSITHQLLHKALAEAAQI